MNLLRIFPVFLLAQNTFSDNRIPKMLPERFARRGLPEKPNQENEVLDCESVQFYLATRQDPTGSTEACLKQNTPLFNGKLNVTKPSRVLVHGWNNDRFTDFTQTVTKAYLEVEDVNVIQVDWSKDAKLDYLSAAYRVPAVGDTLAKFIQELVKQLDFDIDKLHLIGFSLGAQVVGIAGYNTTPKIPQVIGLDPAGPLFELNGPTGKLTKESGRFVVTLHVCKYRLGTFEDLGHLNFNANGGMSQPGCWDSEMHDVLGFCSHARAPEYFAASMTHPEGFTSTKCSSFFEYELDMCKHHPTTYFNPNFNESLSGAYYFRTSSTPPYVLSGNPSTTFTGQSDVSNLSALDDSWKGELPKDAEAKERMVNFNKNLNEMLEMGKLPLDIKGTFPGGNS